MEELDRRAVEWLSSLHWPVVTPVMKGLTYAGAGGTIWIVIALVVAFRRRRPLVLVAMVATIIVASRLDAILKDAIGRARPFVGDPSVHPSIALPHDPSMPSGHAMNAFAGAVLLGSIVPRARWWLLALACAIALSRVYLGVHFASDVLAGAALGAAIGAAAAWLLPRAECALAAWRTKRGLSPHAWGIIASMPDVVRPPGLVLTEHEFSVPLDHDRPDGERITVFAREVADPEGTDRPFLVYFQGGPGSEAPRPTRRPGAPAWLDRALEEFRVLMLDQRGTGRSTPVGALAGLSPQEQADYLIHFRADSIVRDAEWIRRELGVGRWSVLGQSFGGFCVTTYLSFAPEGLREAFITGGLPPVGRPTDDVYRLTYERVLERTRRYYERYPSDRGRMRELRDRLEAEDVRLPSGDRLTGPRMRQLGMMLGMGPGAERLHYILELPHDSYAFLHDVESALDFRRNPIYSVIHEACYADGCATRWSAERLLPPAYADDPELLTGEHVYPWMFRDYGSLAPLREAADILAEHEWPRLYDGGRLAGNEVPAAAIIYAEDMYVERVLSEQTAAGIRGLRPWVTNEYEHDGLRADGERILGRLIDLARGNA